MCFFINNDYETNINKKKIKNITSISLRNINSSLKKYYKFSIFCFLIIIVIIYSKNNEIYKSLLIKIL